jgi:hypothetical protein
MSLVYQMLKNNHAGQNNIYQMINKIRLATIITVPTKHQGLKNKHSKGAILQAFGYGKGIC